MISWTVLGCMPSCSISAPHPTTLWLQERSSVTIARWKMSSSCRTITIPGSWNRPLKRSLNTTTTSVITRLWTTWHRRTFIWAGARRFCREGRKSSSKHFRTEDNSAYRWLRYNHEWQEKYLLVIRPFCLIYFDDIHKSRSIGLFHSRVNTIRIMFTAAYANTVTQGIFSMKGISILDYILLISIMRDNN